MSTNRFSLFSATAKYIKLTPENFLQAITKGDSAAIDCMLELKRNGCELDINGHFLVGNPLRECLKRKDFDNAKKLLQAGAEKCYYTKEYFGDGWGEWELKRHDLFEEFAGNEDVIDFLRNDTRRNAFDKMKQEYENAKAFIADYEKMTQESGAGQKMERRVNFN